MCTYIFRTYVYHLKLYLHFSFSSLKLYLSFILFVTSSFDIFSLSTFYSSSSRHSSFFHRPISQSYSNYRSLSSFFIPTDVNHLLLDDPSDQYRLYIGYIVILASLNANRGSTQRGRQHFRK